MREVKAFYRWVIPAVLLLAVMICLGAAAWLYPQTAVGGSGFLLMALMFATLSHATAMSEATHVGVTKTIATAICKWIQHKH